MIDLELCWVFVLNNWISFAKGEIIVWNVISESNYCWGILIFLFIL